MGGKENGMDNYSLSVGAIVFRGTEVLLVRHNYDGKRELSDHGE